MKLETNLTEAYRHPRRGLLQLAMYALHLGTGSTLLCHTIKSDTIKKYVNAAASFLALFGPFPRDLRKDNAVDAKVSRTLSAVYDEQKRWEDVPNRREPFTLERNARRLELDDLSSESVANACGPNTQVAALVDWFVG
jgi:hypothetical protein